MFYFVMLIVSLTLLMKKKWKIIHFAYDWKFLVFYKTRKNWYFVIFRCFTIHKYNTTSNSFIIWFIIFLNLLDTIWTIKNYATYFFFYFIKQINIDLAWKNKFNYKIIDIYKLFVNYLQFFYLFYQNISNI